MSGRIIDVRDPDPQQFVVEDIAHALSLIPRWGGHARAHYPVAHHSVNAYRVARWWGLTPEACFEALMHDCAEAYLGDFIRPIKELMPAYKRLEELFLLRLSERFGFRYPFCYGTHVIDRLLRTEEGCLLGKERQIFGPPPSVFEEQAAGRLREHVLELGILPLIDSPTAERYFLAAFRECVR